MTTVTEELIPQVMLVQLTPGENISKLALVESRCRPAPNSLPNHQPTLHNGSPSLEFIIQHEMKMPTE